MSNLISALDGVVDAHGIAKIEEIGLQGMITLRGDLANAKVKKAAKDVAGVDMPGQGQANTKGDQGIAWMSPDELLVLCAYDTVTASLEEMRKALGKTHSLAVDVSDARASFRVSGSGARETMAKLAPVDLRTTQFTPGMFRRTRMAQVPAAFWMPEDDVFQIICFRSNAQYLFDVLVMAAQAGSEVGHL